jgi:hypothetical protein
LQKEAKKKRVKRKLLKEKLKRKEYKENMSMYSSVCGWGVESKPMKKEI